MFLLILDFTCPATIVTSTDAGEETAMVTWLDPIADDTTDNVYNITCFPSSGTKFTIGTSSVVCLTRDNKGNNHTCHFDVKVEGKMH